MYAWNIFIGWAGMCIGTALGMLFGLRAESRQWADGYGSFRRQCLRLAHISAFALGIINVLYGLSIDWLPSPHRLGVFWNTILLIGSRAMIAGGLLMPVACLLAAWRKALVPLFVVPAICVLVAVLVQAALWLRVLCGG